MRDTRLIFVEGIMGSGKSSAVNFLAGQLRRQGIAARCVWEDGAATEDDDPEAAGQDLGLRVALGLPHPHAVWRGVTCAEFVARSLERWRAFAESARRGAAITVCDGLLFHGNATDLLLMDAAPEAIAGYVRQVAGILRDLRPAVIYLYQDDVALAIRRICDLRGSDWQAYQVNWKLPSPYATRRGLDGLAGFVRLYEDYRALCDALLAQLELPTLALNTAAGRWQGYYRDMLTFLALPAAPETGEA